MERPMGRPKEGEASEYLVRYTENIMNMITFESLIGILGSLTAASLFFPQVYTSWKTKRTADLAWFGIVVGMLNGIFWSTYGVLKLDPFIYVTNGILFLGAFLLMVLKKRYG